MGKITTTITVTNFIDEVTADRGFIPVDDIRTITLASTVLTSTASLEREASPDAASGLPLSRSAIATDYAICDYYSHLTH